MSEHARCSTSFLLITLSRGKIWLESYAFFKEFFICMINSDNIRLNTPPQFLTEAIILYSSSIYPAEWGSLFLNTIVHFSETLPPLSNPPTNGWGKQRGAYITSSEVPQSNTKKWDRVFLAICIFSILWLFRFVIHSYNLLFQIALTWPKNRKTMVKQHVTNWKSRQCHITPDDCKNVKIKETLETNIRPHPSSHG